MVSSKGQFVFASALLAVRSRNGPASGQPGLSLRPAIRMSAGGERAFSQRTLLQTGLVRERGLNHVRRLFAKSTIVERAPGSLNQQVGTERLRQFGSHDPHIRSGR